MQRRAATRAGANRELNDFLGAGEPGDTPKSAPYQPKDDAESQILAGNLPPKGGQKKPDPKAPPTAKSEPTAPVEQTAPPLATTATSRPTTDTPPKPPPLPAPEKTAADWAGKAIGIAAHAIKEEFEPPVAAAKWVYSHELKLLSSAAKTAENWAGSAALWWLGTPPRNPALQHGPAATFWSAADLHQEIDRVIADARDGKMAKTDIVKLLVEQQGRALGGMTQAEYDAVLTKAKALLNIAEDNAGDPEKMALEIQHALTEIIPVYHGNVPNLALAWLTGDANCVARALSVYLAFRDLPAPPGYKLMEEEFAGSATHPGHVQMVWWNGKHGADAVVRDLITGAEKHEIGGDLYQPDAMLQGEHPDTSLLVAKHEVDGSADQPTTLDVYRATRDKQRLMPIQAGLQIASGGSAKGTESRTYTDISSRFADEVDPSGHVLKMYESNGESRIRFAHDDDAERFIQASDSDRESIIVKDGTNEKGFYATLKKRDGKEMTLALAPDTDLINQSIFGTTGTLNLKVDTQETAAIAHAVLTTGKLPEVVGAHLRALAQKTLGDLKANGVLDKLSVPREWNDPSVVAGMKDLTEVLRLLSEEKSAFAASNADPELQTAVTGQIDKMRGLFAAAPQTMFRYAAGGGMPPEMGKLYMAARDLWGVPALPAYAALEHFVGEKNAVASPEQITRPQKGSPNANDVRVVNARDDADRDGPQSKNQDSGTPSEAPSDGTQATAPKPRQEKKKRDVKEIVAPPPTPKTNAAMSLDGFIGMWEMSGDPEMVARLSAHDFDAFSLHLLRPYMFATPPNGLRTLLRKSLSLRRQPRSPRARRATGDLPDREFGYLPLPMATLLHDTYFDGPKDSYDKPFRERQAAAALSWLQWRRQNFPLTAGAPNSETLPTTAGAFVVNEEEAVLLSLLSRDTHVPVPGIDKDLVGGALAVIRGGDRSNVSTRATPPIEWTTDDDALAGKTVVKIYKDNKPAILVRYGQRAVVITSVFALNDLRNSKNPAYVFVKDAAKLVASDPEFGPIWDR